MTTNCFQISEGLQLTPCDYDSALAATKTKDSIVWIDIQGFEKDMLREKLDDLEVQGMARRLCLDSHDRPGFYPAGQLTFMVVQVLAAEGDFHGVDYVAFLVRKNLLLTLRNTRADRLQNTIDVKESADWLPDSSIQGLIASLMIVFSLEALQRTSELRDMIVTLEQKMDSQPDLVEMDEISHKRSELLTFESVVSAQLPLLEAFVLSKQISLKREKIRDYLLCASANLKAADKSLDWLEGRIDILRSTVEMRNQEKINRRLGRLTVVSAIFLPLTFLAGLWGMNFENMPGLKYPLGYPIALASMFLIAVGIYFYFRRKGWFG